MGVCGILERASTDGNVSATSPFDLASARLEEAVKSIDDQLPELAQRLQSVMTEEVAAPDPQMKDSEPRQGNSSRTIFINSLADRIFQASQTLARVRARLEI